MNTDESKKGPRFSDLKTRISLAMILSLVALTIPLVITSVIQEAFSLDPLQRRILESLFVAFVIAFGIWQLRIRLDRGIPVSIGLGDFQQAFLNFLLGFGLLLIPLLINLLITVLAGWAQVTINWKSAQPSMILLGMFSVFLTDAFPEELIFRGYIFSNLTEKFTKWKSALLTTFLFVLFPIILIPLKGLMGSDITTGLVNSISVGYISYLLFFGAFAVYLRVLTNSVWTGIGFHLMFVYINQIMGLESTNLIQFSNFTSETPAQITFILLLSLTFIALIAYPRIKGINLGWFDKNANH